MENNTIGINLDVIMSLKLWQLRILFIMLANDDGTGKVEISNETMKEYNNYSRSSYNKKIINQLVDLGVITMTDEKDTYKINYDQINQFTIE